MTIIEEGHLGGFYHGGDPGTYAPWVWDALIKRFVVSSVLDVGCAEGHALRYFYEKGVEIAGVDGSSYAVEHSLVPEFVTQHDFTTGPFAPQRRFDLVWSCEFVEHVAEEYVSNFLVSFGCGSVVALTHAHPGQGGYHHVNCQPDKYWIQRIVNLGYSYHERLSLDLRAASPHVASGHWVRNSLLIFSRSICSL